MSWQTEATDSINSAYDALVDLRDIFEAAGRSGLAMEADRLSDVVESLRGRISS